MKGKTQNMYNKNNPLWFKAKINKLIQLHKVCKTIIIIRFANTRKIIVTLDLWSKLNVGVSFANNRKIIVTLVRLLIKYRSEIVYDVTILTKFSRKHYRIKGLHGMNKQVQSLFTSPAIQNWDMLQAACPYGYGFVKN